MTSESENKLLARRLLEDVVNTRDVDRLSEFLAPHFVVHHANITGIEGFRDHVLAFHRWYPDLVVTVEGQVAEGDMVVTWWTMRGTHLGEFGGCAAHKETDHVARSQRPENPRWPNRRAFGRVQLPGSITGVGSRAVVRRRQRCRRNCPTMRCTEWRPRHAAWQFECHGGAAIGELIVSLYARIHSARQGRTPSACR